MWSEEVGTAVIANGGAFEECLKEEIGINVIGTRHRELLRNRPDQRLGNDFEGEKNVLEIDKAI